MDQPGHSAVLPIITTCYDAHLSIVGPPMSVTMKHKEIGYSKLGHKRPSKLRSSISHEEGFQPGTKLENLRQGKHVEASLKFLDYYANGSYCALVMLPNIPITPMISSINL